MRDSGAPTTIAEVVATLRFIMAFAGGNFEEASFDATPAERAAFYRANMNSLFDDEPAIARAIIALEAMIAPPADTAQWETKLARYQALRAYSDTLGDDEATVDDAVDAYCDALDDSIERTPAPTAEALAVKMDLAGERWFYQDYVGAAWWSIRADALRLAGRA